MDIDIAAGRKAVADLQLRLSAVQDTSGRVRRARRGADFADRIFGERRVGGRKLRIAARRRRWTCCAGLPGVEINQSGGRGTVTSAFIRGGDSDYNLVMIDGIQLNDFGGGFDLSPLPAEGVEQVEVIRGPESALYGSNAVAGVINIETIRGDGPPHFSFMGEAREFLHVACRRRRARATERGIQLGVQYVAHANATDKCRMTVTAISRRR